MEQPKFIAGQEVVGTYHFGSGPDDTDPKEFYWVLKNGANVATSATIGPDVMIGPGVIIEYGAVIGGNVQLWHFVHVGAGAKIGAGADLGEGCFVADGCVIGARTRVGEGCYIGPDNTIPEDMVLHNRLVVQGESIQATDPGIHELLRLIAFQTDAYPVITMWDDQVYPVTDPQIPPA